MLSTYRDSRETLEDEPKNLIEQLKKDPIFVSQHKVDYQLHQLDRLIKIYDYDSHWQDRATKLRTELLNAAHNSNYHPGY
ncbi:MAG: hypothetical protein CMF31_01940 [Kordiimonas sp.]|nr:hypothetical protein [Kordiimonas sp.]|tara:strand:+ start:2517 stop:2756 length:240 start_codon:yes stop_codon:yes gene_type:complete